MEHLCTLISTHLPLQHSKKSSKIAQYFWGWRGKLGTVSCVCLGPHESLGEVTAPWWQGRRSAWYLPTVLARGRELDTSGTNYRDNLLSNGFNTRLRVVQEQQQRGTLWPPPAHDFPVGLNYCLRDSSKWRGLHESPSVKGMVRAQ